MNLRFKRCPRPPGADGDLVVAHCGRQSDETIPFNAMPVPRVHRINLNDNVGSIIEHVCIFGFELVVEWKAEVAHVSVDVHVPVVVRRFQESPRDVRHRASLVVLHRVVSNYSIHFIFINIFEDPPVSRQKYFKHYVSAFSLEARSLHDLAENCDSVLHVFLGLLHDLLADLLDHLLWRLDEARTDEVLPQFDFSGWNW